MENNEKKYGTTVFDYVPDKDKEVIESDFFKESEYSKDEIEEMRNDMITNENPKVTASVTKDAISGIMASKPLPFEDDQKTEEEFKEIDKLLHDNDISGKTITKYGKNLISNLMNREPSDEECKEIAEKFEIYKDKLHSAAYKENGDTLGHLNDSISINDLKDILPESINNQIIAVSGTEYETVLRRFIYQLFFAYDSTTTIKDHISELNEISKNIKKISTYDPNATDEDNYSSMEDMNNYLSKYMEIAKNLDKRNSMMRQDYTIDDIDIYTIKEIKECLDDAVSFKSVKDKVKAFLPKLKKDIRRIDEMNTSIDKWIKDIKNDSKVLYTFPCNDYLSAEQSREKICEFLFNAYLANIAMTNNIEIPDDRDLCDYLLEKEIITNDEIKNLKNKAVWFLYVISRTYKYNKVEGNEKNVRKLSYTLDIISKLGMKDHLDRVVDASNYIFDAITYDKL